jgi:hypothetical protein
MTNVKEWTTRTAETAEKWGAGPWQDEPDKIQWVDEATNLDCLMHRHPVSGHWCGYVGVSEGHPYFEVGYSGCSLKPPCAADYCDHSPDVDVHGGLTYAAFCREGDDESKGVCHVPEAGRPHRVWWLGFDCAHSGDVSSLGYRNDSNYRLEMFSGYDTYKDRRYVENQIRRLAKQLAAPPVTKDEP